MSNSKSKALLFLGTSSLLFLTGCQNELSALSNHSENVSSLSNETVAEVNTITEIESNLQEAYERTFEEDEDLSSFSDESSPVFENIQTRRDSIENVQSHTSDLEKISTSLADFEAEEVDPNQVAAWSDSLQTSIDTLNSYTDTYASSLDEQTSYFQSLGTEEANNEILVSGIESIQATDQTINDLLAELEESFSQLQEETSNIQSTVQGLAEEGEG